MYTKNYKTSAKDYKRVVAQGILMYGTRPVSISEFAKATGVSMTAAKTVVEITAMISKLPHSGPIIVPGTMSR